jgi:hypothetical protein
MASAPADTLLRVGIAVTALGLVFTLVALIPLFFPDIALSGAWWFLSMLTGVGLALVIAGLIRASRARRRRVP